MKLNFNNLPVGSLPYEDINLCKQMMLRIYENIPFLAELPLIDSNDTYTNRTYSNIPGISFKDKKILILDSDSSIFMKAAALVEKAYNSGDKSELQRFAFTAPFFELYSEMLKRIKPQYTLIRFVGPYSFAENIFNKNTAELLTDKIYRKFIVQSISAKVMWFLNKVKEFSPETKTIVVFDEPQLYKFGTLKRINEEITKDTVVTLFSKLYQKIKKEGAIVCVQSFEKCNWQLILESDADIISFDAYNNPNSLNIIAEKINNFLHNGGYLNWGIMPVTNESIIKSYSIDILTNKYKATIDSLANEGISRDLLYSKSTTSIQGELSNLPILFAEKALILTNQLSKKTLQ